ncbi:helix-turn-helix domain-containing protein [Deinococcus detaillensis]|uniref:Helix-turn-helix domain-containing protein n=1 Tax=Deinococcus detaillensis TaxID=2592048 RepID=A0A553UHF0_9DEIO|nr:helix-turn-helix domain-containing protein [Deinococcus detaillensis]TSA79643.1 helix-turn-helix domain-containing protein [Deinococcus detaillensis]
MTPTGLSVRKTAPKRATWAAPPADLLAVAFVTDAQAAAYLGLSIRSARYLASEGKLKRVYPRPRAARVTTESLHAYRQAIENGTAPRIWSQPGNPHTQVAPAPEPEPKKKGLLERWGIGGD